MTTKKPTRGIFGSPSHVQCHQDDEIVPFNTLNQALAVHIWGPDATQNKCPRREHASAYNLSKPSHHGVAVFLPGFLLSSGQASHAVYKSLGRSSLVPSSCPGTGAEGVSEAFPCTSMSLVISNLGALRVFTLRMKTSFRG